MAGNGMGAFRSDMQTGEMNHYLWKTNTVLVKNKFGIPEPDHGDVISPENIDLVFVPLLAFDRHGQLVGYGKGMYDRFLKQCRPDVRTIGLSLFEPVLQIEDADSVGCAAAYGGDPGSHLSI